jgi:lipopolysaccharide assembly outer membrane protein LptD (OstA)
MKLIFTILSFFCVVTYSLAQKSPASISFKVFNADHISYNKETGITTYTGNVSFKSGNNQVVKAEKVVYDKKNNKIIAYSPKSSKLEGTLKRKER